MRPAQLALSQRKVLVPLGFTNSDRIDVHDVVSAGMRAAMEPLARVEPRFRGIESNQRAQKWVREVGIDIMLIAVDVNLHSYCQRNGGGTRKDALGFERSEQ